MAVVPMHLLYVVGDLYEVIVYGNQTFLALPGDVKSLSR